LSYVLYVRVTFFRAKTQFSDYITLFYKLWHIVVVGIWHVRITSKLGLHYCSRSLTTALSSPSSCRLVHSRDSRRPTTSPTCTDLSGPPTVPVQRRLANSRCYGIQRFLV